MFRRQFVQAGLGGALALAATRRAAAAPGADLVLAQSAPLSGPLAAPVRAFSAGARLAFDQVNARGGIGGRAIRWISVDDRGQPELARAICERLLGEHRALALFGCAGSLSTAAVEPLLRDSGAPSLGGLWVADSVREQCRGAAYFVRASHAQEAEALASHLATVGLQRIGVVHLATPFGQEGLKLVADALARHRLTLAGSAAVTDERATAQEAARKLFALDPQAVVLFVSGAQAASILAEARSLRRHPAFYGLSVVSDEEALRRLGPPGHGLAVSQVAPYPWSESDRQITEYRAQAAAAGVPIGYASLEGWLDAQVMVEALRRCGGQASRARLQATLQVMQLYIAGMTVDFSRRELAGSRFVELVQLTGSGRYLR